MDIASSESKPAKLSMKKPLKSEKEITIKGIEKESRWRALQHTRESCRWLQRMLDDAAQYREGLCRSCCLDSAEQWLGYTRGWLADAKAEEHLD